jgi:hypothetical protein
MDWMIRRLRFNPRQRVFPLTSVSRLAVVPTQPPVQWIPGVLSPGVKCGQGMTLTTHPHLVSRSWMSRRYTSSPPCASVGVLWGCFTYVNHQTSGYIILLYFLETSQKSGNLQQARWQCLKVQVCMFAHQFWFIHKNINVLISVCHSTGPLLLYRHTK